jgi:glycosyltransferase 2 family protein
VILRLRENRGRFAAILASAAILWVLHLAQFSLALRAASGSADTALLWSRVPMAIFIGLLPITFAGVGTRDAAMVYFLAATTGEGVAMALGVFATLRYVLVALAGLPFMLRLPIDRAAALQGRSSAGSTAI